MKKGSGFRSLAVFVFVLFAFVCLVACSVEISTTDTVTTAVIPDTASADVTTTTVRVTSVVSNTTEGGTVTSTVITATEAVSTTTAVPITVTEAVSTTTAAPVTTIEAVSTTTVVVITTEPETPSDRPSEFIIYSIEMLGRYGDATLIKYGDFEILVDGGTSKDAAGVKAALGKWVTDGHLDMLIVSHPDSDHIDGIENLSTFSSIDSIGMIIQNGDTRGNSDFENNIVGHFTSAVSKTIVEVMADDNYRTIAVDNYFSITFLDQANYYNSSASKNNKSIAFIVTFENTVLFMGGDMESGACTSLMQNNPDLIKDEQFVIYKALHHASNGTNKEDFLNYIKPDLAFISTGLITLSDGTPNYNTHPYPEAVARIAKHTARIYWSSLIGNTTITCDGEDATVTSEGRSKDYYYQTKSQSSLVLCKKEDEIAITIFETRYYLYLVEYQEYTDYYGISKNGV